MSTFLWKSMVFGPIHSRRVGTSLGINVLPLDRKLCSFDCVYCECGKKGNGKAVLPTLQEFRMAVEEKFKSLFEEGVHVDSISFTGNGEPTMHPDFPAMIDVVIKGRDKWLAGAVISVFSNATCLGRKGVAEALAKVDNPILKLDAVSPGIFAGINRPQINVDPQDIVSALVKFGSGFVLQTLFFHSTNPAVPSNVDPQEAAVWQEVVLKIRPRKVMLYSIDRETPVEGLAKATKEELEEIARPLREQGIECEVWGA